MNHWSEVFLGMEQMRVSSNFTMDDHSEIGSNDIDWSANFPSFRRGITRPRSMLKDVKVLMLFISDVSVAIPFLRWLSDRRGIIHRSFKGFCLIWSRSTLLIFYERNSVWYLDALNFPPGYLSGFSNVVFRLCELPIKLFFTICDWLAEGKVM